MTRSLIRRVGPMRYPITFEIVNARIIVVVSHLISIVCNEAYASSNGGNLRSYSCVFMVGWLDSGFVCASLVAAWWSLPRTQPQRVSVGLSIHPSWVPWEQRAWFRNAEWNFSVRNISGGREVLPREATAGRSGSLQREAAAGAGWSACFVGIRSCSCVGSARGAARGQTMCM